MWYCSTQECEGKEMFYTGKGTRTRVYSSKWEWLVANVYLALHILGETELRVTVKVDHGLCQARQSQHLGR